jgi:hypothetical protein
MSTPPKQHNCPLLNLFKGCGCGSPSESTPSCCDHSHDHAHDQPHGHSHAETTPTPSVPADATDGTVSEEQAKQLLADLQAFDSNPKEFMDRKPLKRTEQAGAGGEALPHFDQTSITDKAYVAARDELRTRLDSDEAARSARAAFAANDLAQNLVDTYSYTSLQSMQAANLMSATLSTQPWSDYYWAIFRGILGYRYADPGFPKTTEDWNTCHSYVQSRPASSVPVDNLSPSEKYDLLVGDSNFTLTKQMWNEGARMGGNVASWMGICHGWSPASYMLPRPTNAVTVLAADGHTQITFYPSDIKGLASLLWAKVPPAVKFIGGRCNVSNPARDANGRLIEQACFDTNPGTWHLAIVNQIGASKRGMVMDVTYDYEVWNQPVLGYRYRHFNPQSMTYQSNLSAAAVSRSAYTRDKFSQYHGGQTASIVGIEMVVSYLVETLPDHSATDSPSNDAVKQVKYMYDLELDMSGRIVGGEWRHLAHPDFLWTPAKGARAQTAFEPSGLWDRNQPVPSNWRSAAVSASSSGKPAPLAAVVEHLIKFANS